MDVDGMISLKTKNHEHIHGKTEPLFKLLFH